MYGLTFCFRIIWFKRNLYSQHKCPLPMLHMCYTKKLAVKYLHLCMVCFKKLTIINNVFKSQYYSFFMSETIVKSTDIDIFRFFCILSCFLFSLKVHWASILFSFMQYWANNTPEKTSFFQLLPLPCLLLPSNWFSIGLAP